MPAATAVNHQGINPE